MPSPFRVYSATGTELHEGGAVLESPKAEDELAPTHAQTEQMTGERTTAQHKDSTRQCFSLPVMVLSAVLNEQVPTVLSHEESPLNLCWLDDIADFDPRYCRSFLHAS